jgi:hypothetical protein
MPGSTRFYNQRRYHLLKRQGRCIQCAEKLEVGNGRVRCISCHSVMLEKVETKRGLYDLKKVPVVVSTKRCQVCHLLLPHECMGGSAQARSGPGRVFP